MEQERAGPARLNQKTKGDNQQNMKTNTQEQQEREVRYTRAITAVRDLKRIRNYLTSVNGLRKGLPMPKLVRKIRSAIKSAEGAANNAWRFANR